jgi:precorrin-3B synthase
VLAAASVELGDGRLELTSRANVQIRALQPGEPVELSDRLYAAGLLPSISHERVRNILASPLSGLDSESLYDVLPAVAELDRQLCARAGLAELPGRFLFALDDGRGDLASVKADVAVRMVAGDQAALLLGGVATGVLVHTDALPAVMVEAAEAFLAERAIQQSEAWRLAELEDGPRRVLERMGLAEAAHPDAGAAHSEAAGGLQAQTPPRPQTGWYAKRGGGVALVVTVPLGVLSAEQAEALAEVAGSGQLRVTPWRSVVLTDLAAESDAVVRRLERVGLVLDAESPWSGVTACAGRPGCGKALADVRGDARRVVPRLVAGGRAVHWSGCERRCGRPGGESVDVVALEGGGYSIDGVVGDVEAEINKVRTQ